MDNDLTWEFNCPQFVDFLEDSLENDDGADAFFGIFKFSLHFIVVSDVCLL